MVYFRIERNTIPTGDNVGKRYFYFSEAQQPPPYENDSTQCYRIMPGKDGNWYVEALTWLTGQNSKQLTKVSDDWGTLLGTPEKGVSFEEALVELTLASEHGLRCRAEEHEIFEAVANCDEAD